MQTHSWAIVLVGVLAFAPRLHGVGLTYVDGTDVPRRSMDSAARP
jgi:hypothetical protein